MYILAYRKKKTYREDVSQHDKELSSHDSHSDDKLQELLNDHATYASSFTNKGIIQNDHRLYDQSR